MQSVEELLQGLTPPQQAAVVHTTGPLLIIAGAGSGKTRVLTRRLAYLVATGVDPWRLCAITFTNKAAGEMKERVGQLLGRAVRDFGRLDSRWPTICTFHSLCLRVLRAYAPQLGLENNFTIYDTADQTRVVKEATKLCDLSSTNFAPGTVLGAISNAKNKLLTAEQYAAGANDYFARNVARIFTKYQSLLAQNAAVDFDDLLVKTVFAMKQHPTILGEMQDRFSHLMIDEYQDTNHAQYMLAHALAGKHRNVAVVGDPDQSIYAWRGADIQNILEFEKDYPDATVVKLEQNYRSTKTILKIAQDLIQKNLRRRDKGLHTDNPQGDPVDLLLCQDEHDEAMAITSLLRQYKESMGLEWREVAIFYRMNSLSRVMEDALRRAKVPYQIARGVEFYGRREIKDVLSYLRVIANRRDDVSLERIANVPARGLSDTTISAAAAFASGNGISLFDALQRAPEIPGMTARAVKSAQQFMALMNRWRDMAATMARRKMDADGLAVEPADDGPAPATLFAEPVEPAEPAAPEEPRVVTKGALQLLMEDVVALSGYEAHLRKTGDADLSEIANVGELISSAAEFDAEHPAGSLDDYLAQVSLVSDVDRMDSTGGAVTLMTLHAAKGLEFPLVAMIGLENGCLPHSRAEGNLDELEEERRLCFVGITRAMRRLILSKAQFRTVRGMRERTASSIFLTEIPRDLLRIVDRTGAYAPRDSYASSPPTSAADAGPELRQGQFVRHEKFGVGRVLDVSGIGQNTRVQVDFPGKGKKTLVLEFTKLEVVK